MVQLIFSLIFVCGGSIVFWLLGEGGKEVSRDVYLFYTIGHRSGKLSFLWGSEIMA